MQSPSLPSIEELRVEFINRGLLGVMAFLAAEQKYADMSRGVDLPYELYVKGFTGNSN